MDTVLAQYGFDEETAFDDAWRLCTPEVCEELTNDALSIYVGIGRKVKDNEGRGDVTALHFFVEDVYKTCPELIRCIHIQWKNGAWHVIKNSWPADKWYITYIAPEIEKRGHRYVDTFHRDGTWDYYHYG